MIADPTTLYFGATLRDDTLTPGPNPLLGSETLEDWLRQSISAD